jgi:hypothetical protein
MRRLVAAAFLSLGPLLIACADQRLPSPVVTPSARLSPAVSEPTATPEPIGAMPADCEPGPDPTPVSDHVGEGIGADPAWAIGFGPTATLTVNRDDPYADHGWLRKVLWLVRRSVQDPVTITGLRVDDGSPLWFDYGAAGDQATSVVLDPAAPDGEYGDWYEYRGYFVLPSAGCYRLMAAWPGGGWEIDFRAGLDVAAA